ncbi:hypothetical protein H7I02_13000 [Mycolicibacterium brumae]|nr:hypothetical protein [Mycolicibacterium brumae]
MLTDGRDGIVEVPADRWDAEAFYDTDPLAPGRMPSKWGGFIPGVAGFDAEHFGITPREAAAMDPQQRLLLEVAWEALENAGLDPSRLAGVRAAVTMGAHGALGSGLSAAGPARRNHRDRVHRRPGHSGISRSCSGTDGVPAHPDLGDAQARRPFPERRSRAVPPNPVDPARGSRRQ